MNRCIITAASNKFFPSLLNFLGSLHINYPGHPKVFVYDLGLAPSFKKELASIDFVTILEIPHFVPHWRSCYTWKTYILNTPLADANLYIDAGSQILIPLDELFEEIESRGYMLVSQGFEVRISDITPSDYVELFSIKEELLKKEVAAAGIVGFKKDSVLSPVTSALYASGVAGLCLGFSKKDQWKNKGVNRTSFVRNCPLFRHDTTMFSILVQKMLPEAILHPVEEFSGNTPSNMPSSNTKQYIWNVRLLFRKLQYTKAHILHKRITAAVYLNRLIIGIFYFLKEINRLLKDTKSRKYVININ